jgi:hypothetical protein
MAAIGVSELDKERAQSLVESGANILVIDVAHGHHKNVLEMIKWCKNNLDDKVDIIAGNIATVQAAMELETYGADGLRVGIGGGSLCTTRIKTGFGIPNVSCLEEIIRVAKTPVMADGGIRTSGDISKALALGSSSVMLGSLLAGTDEAPGKIIETPKGSTWETEFKPRNNEVYDDYVKFCKANGFSNDIRFVACIRNFNNRCEELEIPHRVIKSCGNNEFRFTPSEVNAHLLKKKWINREIDDPEIVPIDEKGEEFVFEV